MIYPELLRLLIHIYQPDWLASSCNIYIGIGSKTIHRITWRKFKLLLRLCWFSMNHHFQVLLRALAQTVVIVVIAIVIERLLTVVDHRDFAGVLLFGCQFLDDAISPIESVLFCDSPHFLIIVRLRLTAISSPRELARCMLICGHALDLIHWSTLVSQDL